MIDQLNSAVETTVQAEQLEQVVAETSASLRQSIAEDVSIDAITKQVEGLLQE